MTPAQNPPSVAVVIPCWNAEKWIARAIQSVLDQDYPNLRLVVIDDGSTDRSLEVVRAFGDKLAWESGPHLGAPYARNRGLELISSEFVLFLDADDYLEGPLIANLVDTAVAEDADLTLGSTVIEWPDGRRSKRMGCEANLTNPAMIKDWLEGRAVQTGGQFWRRAFLNAIGAWDPAVARQHEVELGLRALLADAKVAVSDGGAAIWSNHDDPRRLHFQNNRVTLTSTVEYLDRHGAVAAARHPGLELAFARDLYETARRAMANGYFDIGRDALAKSRALGLRGHPGSARRALLCRMIGMPRAEYLVIGLRVTRTNFKRFRRTTLKRYWNAVLGSGALAWR